ncbi:5489_t:CDS:2, partial [Acaulospora morrowiae]
MATAELTKRSKAKRRSMPENIGRPTNLLEESEGNTSTMPPTLSPLQLEDSDHHILDLLLNEDFSDVDLGLTQPLTQTASAPREGNNSNEEVSELSKELNEEFQGSEEHSEFNSGKEEINNALVSQDVIESLTAVKNVGLLALDSLLRQIVSEQTSITTSAIQNSSNTARSDTWRRRYSFSHTLTSTNNSKLNDSSSENRDSWIRSQLLADIAHNATKLGTNGEMQQMEPRRSDIATINTIKCQLDSNSPLVPNDDYSLACTLATLLGYLYRILELCQPEKTRPSVDTSNSQNVDAILQDVTNEDEIYSTLHKEVTILQNRHVSLILNDNIADERLTTWNEIDHLMEVVASLCRDRFNLDPPPKYSYDFEEGVSIDPPIYSSLDSDIKLNNEKTQRDLENVISAIDRVYHVMPQLNNQRVELNSRQKKELTAATLSNAIQKLSRGRLEDQRAESLSITKYQTLNHLVDQINKAAERSLSDQRVELSPNQVRHFDTIKLNDIIERLEKNRMTNQDWHSPEQLLVQDLTRLTNELTKTSHPAYASQRYQLSPSKEKDMFMNSVIKRVEKLQSYRMIDQDADSPRERREKAWKEIETIIDKQQNSSMSNQRAT